MYSFYLASSIFATAWEPLSLEQTTFLKDYLVPQTQVWKYPGLGSLLFHSLDNSLKELESVMPFELASRTVAQLINYGTYDADLDEEIPPANCAYFIG